VVGGAVVVHEAFLEGGPSNSTTDRQHDPEASAVVRARGASYDADWNVFPRA
jgi:hypothetical protein